MEARHRIHPVILKRAREMRQPQTAAEATLWQHLRNRNLEYKFRRQHPIERFIIDFYCAELKLCIEIDGDSHMEKEQQEYDAARTEYLESLRCRVIRFTNEDIRFNIHAVAQEIMNICNAVKARKILDQDHPSPNLSPRGEEK
jgi:very-short-patch-repair endonuclease